ncbi:Serine/arginine-rich splicing factor 3, partial [Galemys pyrenaicus]
VGNLGNNGKKLKSEQVCGYYGSFPKSTQTAFVEFEDPLYAAYAVRQQAGRTLCGCLVRSGHTYVIIRIGVLHLAEDLQEWKASPVAGACPFLNREASHHCLGRVYLVSPPKARKEIEDQL